MVKKSYLALLGALIVVGLAGCSKGEYEAGASPAGNYSSESSKAKASLRGGEIADYGATTNGAPLHMAARAPGADRSVIHSATMGLDVDKLSDAEKGMKKIVKDNGGYIVTLESEQQAGQDPTLRLTLRVPEKTFEESMTALEALGFARYKNISASDITEQILDAEARLKQVQREAGTNGTIRINGDYMKGRLKELTAERDALAGQAAMSTIDLVMMQKPNAGLTGAATANWGGDTWNSALSSAMGAFRVVGAIAIWLLVYSPLWGIALFATIWGVKASKRGRVAAQG